MKATEVIDPNKPIEGELRWVCGYGFGEPGNRTTVCPPERECLDACGYNFMPLRETTVEVNTSTQQEQ